MNKKRVALALAAALGINSLMVTVGTVGGQAVIAHAQDSKLSTDLAAKLNTLQIKYLDTSVEVTTNGNAEVTFKNLDFNNVDKIDAGAFAHESFKERDFEQNGKDANGTWDTTTKKLTVKGITDPGIYTGDVTVTYKGGNTEKYTLSLVKKPSDKVSFTTDITTGQLVVKDLKFNNGSQDITNFNPKVMAYIGKDATKAVELNKDTATGNYVVSLLKLGKNGNLDLNDTIKVDVIYGNDQYTLTSDIVLFEDQNSSIKGVTATNDSTNMTTLADTIKTDFGETTAPTLPTHAKDNSKYDIKVGTDTLLTYDQTVMEETTGNTAKVGGAKLKIDPATGKEFKVSVESATKDDDAATLKDNFVPTAKTSFGFTAPAAGANATTSDVALIGDYLFNIDGHGSAVYFDAFTGVNVTTTTSTVTNSIYEYVDITGGKADFTTGIDTNAQVKLDLNNFKHGYQTIPVIFEYDDTADKKIVNDKQPASQTNINVGTQFTGGTVSSVKTSLIISTDKIDGAAVQASFVKTSSSEGKVTIAGGTELLTKIVGSADYTESVLTIAGGTATVNSTESKGKDLIFDVQFNGQVPSTSDAAWTLKIKDKTATGTVDLTGGVVETVNLTSVKATNQGMENVTDQFRVEASFGSAVPTGSKVVEEVTGSDRVTFAQFGVGDHKLISNVGSGKYQGKYSAGVIVSDQPITIQIDEQTKTSSSVTLKIDADFYGNATSGVTAARISYKEVTTNSNPHEGYLDLNIPQDIKEDVITKVVNGLRANTKYEFGVIYTYTDQQNAQPQLIESNILTVTTNSSSSSSGTISGGSSGSGSSSTSSTTVNVTGTNSTTGSNSISVTLPSGTYHHESNSNPSIAGFKYKDKDGKTVTETNDQYSNVKVRFENGRAVVEGLVPGKDYVEISINYNDRNNRTRTLILKNVKINSTNEGQSYLANVYNVVFNRPADENGYMFHLDNLSNKRVSLRSFLLNMINEREFEKIYTTAETKVEALYNAIVNRDSDTQGKAFWVEEYKKLLAVYGSPAATLQAIADRMVNENELKTLAQKIGFEW